MRRAAAALCLAAVLLVGFAAAPPDPAFAAIGPAVAVVAGAVAWGVRLPRRTTAWVGVLLASGASLVVTGLALQIERFAQAETVTVVWMLLEAACLALCVYRCVRWLSLSRAVSGAAAGVLAPAVMIFRFDGPFSPWSAIGGCIVWSLPSLSAAAFASYQRKQAAAAFAAVREAQQEQRLELAGELHDFVAHDISEIVAQAQAGAMVFGGSDASVAQILGRIEAAGLRSLASMDRTIDLLRGDGRSPSALLPDVPALVARYRATGVSDVDLHLDAGLEDIQRDVSALCYRVVVEALTNVRRHAGRAGSVAVDVRADGDKVRLSVTDDGNGVATPRRGSGSGLSGLQARVESMHGEFSAGPLEPAGWRVEVELPLV